jgi:hypothetical protein
LGKTAAVILLLAAIAAAVPVATGTRFGTVGLDYRFSSGRLYTLDSRDRTEYVPIDPFFRAGVAVVPNLAVGAEVALFKTFPDSEDMFLRTPVVAFSPSASYYLLPNADKVRPYVVAGGGATYGFVWRRLGWRVRFGGGAVLVNSLPVAFGIEGGWYEDWTRALTWNGSRLEWTWLQSGTVFLGLRYTAFRQ